MMSCLTAQPFSRRADWRLSWEKPGRLEYEFQWTRSRVCAQR